MSAAKHTPGPWRAGAYSSIIGVPVMAQPEPAQNQINICGVHYGTKDEALANARLIAAAPDLLAALKELLPEGWDDDDAMDHVRGVKAARLAIAKAESRTP